MKVTTTGKCIYGLCQGVTFLLIVVAAALMLGIGWLLLEPREIPQLTRQVQRALNNSESAYYLKVNKTVLGLGDFFHPLNVIMKDVELRGYKSEETAHIPAMHVSLDLWHLLSGRVMPGKITLIEPRLALYQDKKGVVYLSGPQTQKLIPLHALFAASASKEEQDTALFSEAIQEITISAAKISFESTLARMKLEAPAVDVLIRQQDGIFHGKLVLKADQKGSKDLQLAADFSYRPEDHHLSLGLEVDDLTLADYAHILPELEALKDVKLPLSGKITAEAALPSQLQTLSVDMKAGAGTLIVPRYLPRKIIVQEMQLQGTADVAAGEAVLDKFWLKQKYANVRASGKAKRDEAGKVAVEAKAQIKNLSKKTLMKLWPEMISPQTRQWVDSSIIAAQIAQADFTMNAPAGSLETMPFPDEILKAEIALRDAEVDYISGFPHVQQGAGKLVLTGNSLRVAVDQAKLLENTTLTAQGSVEIPDLMADPMAIQIQLPVNTSARDVVNFIGATAYKLPPSLNFKTETLAGELNGKVDVTVLDHVSPTPDDVSFTVDSEVSGFSQPAFYKGMAVKDAKGKLLATEKKLSVNATGLLENQALAFATEVSGTQADYRISATLPHESLKAFGIDTLPYASGLLGLNFHWQESGKDAPAKLDAKVDLTPAVLQYPDIQYNKPAGEAASLDFRGTSQAGVLRLDAFTLKVPERQEEISGTARITQSSGTLEEVVFRTFHFAGSEGQGSYRRIPNGHYLHATGRKLDISYRDEDEATTKEKATKSEPIDIPALDLDLKFDEVIITKDKQKKLQNLTLRMQCNAQFCPQMEMKLNAGANAPFSLNIGQQNNRRTLTAYTPRADILLREMDIFDDMQGGELQIMGIYEDEKPTHPLVGKLVIGEHRVKNVPVLTKLLTVATFTGIVDSLTGSGLMFQKLDVPFVMENFVLHLKDAKTAGPSIGLTASGSIDLNQEQMNLRGTVIPAYMFNALIRSIPVLGNVFGALAGDGLVAVRYSMLGNTDNPDITVNPLSALTPGFLRGFFTIFEAEDTIAKGSEDTTQAVEKLEKELGQIKTQKTDQPPAPAPVAAPTPPKPASVLSPRVKPTVVQ